MKAAALFLLALPAFGQLSDPSVRLTDVEAARLDITPQLNGDVSFEISNSPLPMSAVGQVARTMMGCHWEDTSYDHDDDDAIGDGSGLCRKWLRADATSAEGSLKLAPLVSAIRASGSREVKIRIWTSVPDGVRLPAGWRKQTLPSKGVFHSQRDYVAYTASAPGFTDMPPPFPVTEGERWQPTRLVGMLLFLVFGPAALTLYLKRRALRQGTLNSSAVWLNWILTGSLLYWLSAMRPTDIVGFLYSLHWNNLSKLAIGVALYSLPPLLAMASCLVILDPGDKDGKEARHRLIRLALLQQGALIVPLGLFLAGTSTLGRENVFSVACIPGAYVLYRLISWWAARLRFSGLQHLADGELPVRISAIAQAAGAKLRGVYILRNRLAREVNAFATGTGVIILTQGLVERFPRRELDAIIAHEAGHLRGRHNGIQSSLFWIYIIFLNPAVVLLTSLTALPAWLGGLFMGGPIGPILYILIVARVSQRHEFDADARAAAITGDPEGAIAALARLSRITRSPVDWGGIQGSILTHPSMRNRVLSIARRFQVPESRALALLENPDGDAASPSPAICGEEPPRVDAYALPEEFRHAGPVFNSGAMQSYIFWVSWALNIVLVGFLASLAMVTGALFGPGTAILVFLSCIPAAAWAYLRTANIADMVFRKSLRRRIAARLPHPDDAIFVGILPGPSVRPLEGFYEWDMGFLSLTGDRLTYRGERTRFSLSRSSVRAISVEAGPLSWDRTWAVVVAHDGGAFVLRRPDAGYTKRKAVQLRTRLEAWQLGRAANPAPNTGELLSPPDLPHLAAYAPLGWKLASAHIKRAVMLCIGTLVLFSISEKATSITHVAAFVPLAVPLAYLLAVVPTWLRRERA